MAIGSRTSQAKRRAKQVDREHTVVCSHILREQAAISIIHIGKDLIAAKHYLCHGTFRDWLRAEVGIPPGTAQAYMHVARWASHKSATVALLPPSMLYLISTSSTPQSYVDHILRRAEAGEPIVVSAVRQELKGLREEDRRQQALGTTLPAPRGARRGHGTWPTKDELDPRLQQAVAVLAQGLPTDDFARLRDILTSKSILEDPKLTKKIVAAFSAWTRTRRNDVNASRKPSVAVQSNETEVQVGVQARWKQAYPRNRNLTVSAPASNGDYTSCCFSQKNWSFRGASRWLNA